MRDVSQVDSDQEFVNLPFLSGGRKEIYIHVQISDLSHPLFFSLGENFRRIIFSLMLLDYLIALARFPLDQEGISFLTLTSFSPTAQMKRNDEKAILAPEKRKQIPRFCCFSLSFHFLCSDRW